MIEKAHNTLKGALISDTVMRSTDYFKMFVLQTDASGVGVGAVLSQAGEDAPIAYFSRKLLNCERKYSTLEQECLAIKLGIWSLPHRQTIHHTDRSMSPSMDTTELNSKHSTNEVEHNATVVYLTCATPQRDTQC